MAIDTLVAEYVRLRDERHVLATQDKALKAQMTQLEVQMLDISNELGVNSFKTDYGTVFKTTKTYASVTDREALERYAIENNDLGVFTNHVSKTHIVELLEAGTPQETLGVNFYAESVMQFRK